MGNWRYRIVSQPTAARMEQAGPLIAGAWSRPDDEMGRAVAGEFLIDTGAYGAMIDLDVAESLQLSLQGTRDVHGIHGYGRLQQFFGRISLPASDTADKPTVFTAVLECVGVSSLREKNHEHGVDVIGILGRMFLAQTVLYIDGLSGKVELQIYA